MADTTTPTPNQPLALPAELTLYTVADCQPRWQQWLAETEGPAVADAGAVDEVDAAGLQLVLALALALERDGRHLAIHAPSERFAAACRTLGLATLLAAEAEAS